MFISSRIDTTPFSILEEQMTSSEDEINTKVNGNKHLQRNITFQN